MTEKQEKDLEEVCASVRRILFHLENDPQTNTEGVIAKLNRVALEVEALKTREKVYIAKFTAYGFVGGILGSFILKLLFMIFDLVFKQITK